MAGGQLQRSNSVERSSDGGTFSFSIDVLKASWERSLRAQRKAEQTVEAYLKAVDKLTAWLAANNMSTDIERIGREQLETYIVAEFDRGLAPATVANQYRRLQQFFKWLKADGEITVDPMANMSPPQVPVPPVRVMPDEDISTLFALMRGTGFLERRDLAICRLFYATGMRVSSMAGIRVDDINWRSETVRITVKGDKELDAPFGVKAGEAVDRYLRVRARHRHCGESWLWVGKKGRLRDSGIYQMTVRRAEQAGIEHVHPHLWRHKFGHEFLLDDGSESNLMRLMGWSTEQMARRYGASAADERARIAYRKMGIGDKL